MNAKKKRLHAKSGPGPRIVGNWVSRRGKMNNRMCGNLRNSGVMERQEPRAAGRRDESQTHGLVTARRGIRPPHIEAKRLKLLHKKALADREPASPVHPGSERRRNSFTNWGEKAAEQGKKESFVSSKEDRPGSALTRTETAGACFLASLAARSCCSNWNRSPKRGEESVRETAVSREVCLHLRFGR